MLKLLRTGFAVLCVVLLFSGYIASLGAYPEGVPAYYAWVDRPPVRTLALFLLVIAVILSFIPQQEKE